MKLVVLESPYAGDTVVNVAYARSALRDSIHRGEAPLASHLLYTQPGVLDDDKPEERKLGIDAGLSWLVHAQLHVYYTDLGWSKGMLAALLRSKDLIVPTEFRAIHGPIQLPAEAYRQWFETSNGRYPGW